MVHIRHISLIIFLMWLAVFYAGCAVNPRYTPAPAPVEEHGRSEKPPVVEGEMNAKPAEKGPEPAIQEAPVPASPPGMSITKPLPGEIQETGKSGAAVVALLDTADRESEAGRQGQAVASLERALRIEPKNPLPWHKLGLLRLQEKNWKQALALAKKSNVLAAGNRGLQAENWKIIAQASAALGDTKGAARAWEMVQELEKQN